MIQIRHHLQSLTVLLILTAFTVDKNCPSTGDATDKLQKNFNTKVNRATVPEETQIDRSISLESMLNSKDSATLFDEQYAAAIEGYVFSFSTGKPESCNCYSKDKDDWNYILYLAKDQSAQDLSDCVLVNVTNKSRSINPAWTPEFLKKLTGKKIIVTGWLLFNFSETKTSFESHPIKMKLDRHTAWEICPVTAIKVDD